MNTPLEKLPDQEQPQFEEPWFDDLDWSGQIQTIALAIDAGTFGQPALTKVERERYAEAIRHLTIARSLLTDLRIAR